MFIIVVLVIAVLLIIAVQKATAFGGEPNLYLALQILILIGAALLIAQNQGVL